MIFYGIVDRISGSRWSRNSWGKSNSCPDLYKTKKAAQRQIDIGKIAVMLKYWDFDPYIVTYSLEPQNE